MNAKPRHSMMSRRSKCLLLLMLLGLVFPARLSAQQLWREGGNVSGMALSGEDEGEARLQGSYTSGAFKDPSEGSQLWSAGAGARAERHFRDLFLAGDFSFDLVDGKDMCGSMFTHPGAFPIDVLEFTPGRKVRQVYGIGGALAWKNASRWIPGVSLRFEGENYAKRKDIRHTTYRQELQLVPSLLYKGDGWAAGATFRWDKTSEFIQAEQIGSATSDSYYAFLDKGLMYGACQVWDGSGIHLKEAGVDRLPLKEITYGAGLQASLGDFLYAELEYSRSSGEAGEKGYTWFRFPGWALEAGLSAAVNAGAGRHVFGIRYGRHRQDNYETILEKVTEGGVTTPVQYGSDLIFKQEEISLAPSWRFESESGWELSSDVEVAYNHQLSTMLYPYADEDGGMHLKAALDASVPLGRFTLGAGLRFLDLIDQHMHTLTKLDETLDVSAPPFRLEEWYDLATEAEDAARLGGRVSVRYDIPLPGGHPLYIEAGWDFLHAFRIQYLAGHNRQCTRLTIGYHF